MQQVEQDEQVQLQGHRLPMQVVAVVGLKIVVLVVEVLAVLAVAVLVVMV